MFIFEFFIYIFLLTPQLKHGSAKFQAAFREF